MSDCFPKRLSPFYIPANNIGQLFQTLNSTWYYQFFIIVISPIPVGLFHCGFNIYFPSDNVEHLFTCLLAVYISSSVKCLFKSFVIFNCFACFIIGLPWQLIWFLKNACKAVDTGLIPGSGRSPGEGHGNPLQYSCLENPMDSESDTTQQLNNCYNIYTKTTETQIRQNAQKPY